MADGPAALTFREVFRIPAMRRLWIGQLVSIFGDFLALFAVISIITFRLHGTAQQVTMVSIVYLVPLAFFGPVAGVFVDRWNLRITMISSDLARGCFTLLLLFVHDLWSYYAIFFAISLLSSFFGPAQSVTMRAIVPKEGLLAANALMMQAMQMARIASPALAGALVDAFGPQVCFGFDVVSFFFSAFLLSTMVIIRPVSPPGVPSPGGRGVGAVVTELIGGMRFIFTHSAISFVIFSMAAALFAIGCFGPLFAVYVRDFLKSGSRVFGFVSALTGVGMIVGSQLLPRLSKWVAKQQMVIGGLVVVSGSIVVLGSVPAVVTAGVGMFGIGVGVAFIMGPAQALFQQETPIAMVGRVSSSVMSVLTFAQLVGLIVSGSAAQAMGIRNLFFACAAALAAAAGFGYGKMGKWSLAASL